MDEVKKITDISKEHMLREGYHPPIVFAKGTTGKVYMPFQRFGNTADERVKDMLLAGAMVAEKRYVGELELIILVNEAWMGKNKDILPSRDPNRVETLVINALNVQIQEERLLMFEVIRNDKNKVIDLKQSNIPENVRTHGMLLPAFQKGYQLVRPVMN